MLDIFRYALSLMVVFSHLWPELLWYQGTYAVFCFYVISGYLMSQIINEVYTGYRWLLRYSLNRCLRIYPAYLATFLLLLIAIHVYPHVASYSFYTHVPINISQWAENVTLVYSGGGKLTISQAWSLRVEMIFYFLMAFLVRRSNLVFFWFFLSVCYVVYLELSSTSFMERYMSILGASFAFSTGALVYHVSKSVALSKAHVYLASIMLFIYLVIAPDIWGFTREHRGWQPFFDSGHYGIYGFMIIGAYLLLALAGNKNLLFMGAVSRLLGNLAYPIFLSHLLVAIVLTGAGIPTHNKPLYLLASLVGVHLISLCIFFIIERPINEKVRSKLRDREVVV